MNVNPMCDSVDCERIREKGKNYCSPCISKGIAKIVVLEETVASQRKLLFSILLLGIILAIFAMFGPGRCVC